MTRPTPVALEALPRAAFQVETKVMFAHCDPAGIVFTPRFVDMAHGAIEEFVPGSLGLDYYDIISKARLGLGYAHVELDFFAPAFAGQTLRFTVLVERVGRGSVAFAVHAHHGDTPVLRAGMIVATTNLDEHRAVPVPDWLRTPLMDYQRSCR